MRHIERITNIVDEIRWRNKPESECVKGHYPSKIIYKNIPPLNLKFIMMKVLSC